MNMKILAVALGVAPAYAYAQEPAVPAATAPVKTGAMIFTADGRRLGRVDRVKMEGGAPSAVSVIYDGKYLYVPVSTLTAGERGYTSSLTRAELRK